MAKDERAVVVTTINIIKYIDKLLFALEGFSSQSDTLSAVC